MASNWDPMKDDFDHPMSRFSHDGPARYYSHRTDDTNTGEALYIKNVPISQTKESLQALLEAHGSVIRCSLYKNNLSYQYNKQVAFVTVKTRKDAYSIIEGLNEKPPLRLKVEFGLTHEERAKRRENRELNEKYLKEIQNNSYDTATEDTVKYNSAPRVKKSLIYETLTTKQNINETVNGEDSFSVISQASSNDSKDSKPRLSSVQIIMGKHNGTASTKSLPCVRCNFMGFKRCSVCKAVYCSRTCQQDDWYYHKEKCVPPPPLEGEDSGEEEQQQCEGAAALDKNFKELNLYGKSPEPHNENNEFRPIKRETPPYMNGNRYDRSPSNCSNDSNLKSKKVSPQQNLSNERKHNADNIVNHCKNIQYVKNKKFNSQPNGITNKIENIEHLNKEKVLASVSQATSKLKADKESMNRSQTILKNNSERLSVNDSNPNSHKLLVNDSNPNSLKLSPTPLDVSSKENGLDVKPKKVSPIILDMIPQLEPECTYTAIQVYYKAIDYFCLMMQYGMEKIFNFELKTGKSLLPSKIPHMEVVAAKSSDGCWYRAVVCSLENEFAHVYFVDYGNMEKVIEIRELDNAFTIDKIPGQCLIASIVGSNNKDLLNKLELNIQENRVVTFKVTENKKNFVNVEFCNDKETTPGIIKPWHWAVENELATKSQTNEVSGKSVTFGKASIISSNKNSETIPPVVSLPQPGNKNRFLKNKLPSITIKQDNEYPIVITWVMQDNNIWVQLCTDNMLRELKDIILMVQEHCKKAKIATNLEVGELICAYVEGECWHRGEVISVQNGKFYIHFIDYGNTDYVTADNLREFDPSLMNFAPLSIHVKPEGIGQCVEKVDVIFKSLIDNNECCIMQVLSLNPMTAIIKNVNGVPVLSTTGVSKTPIEHKVEIATIKNEAPEEENKIKQMVISGQYKPIYKMYDECETLSLPIEKNFEVLILSANDPLNIHVTLVDQNIVERFLEMDRKITDYCDTIKTPYYEPREGEICITKFSEDEHWYRAACINKDAKCARMFFVDYANCEIVPFTSICQMIDAFIEVPLLSLHCILKDFNIEKLKSVSPDSLEAFRQKIRESSSCNIDVHSYNDENKIYEISFHDLEGVF